ncbi:MAG TPA: ParB/RepB/Spo0J family partition protein [Anaerolineales bacterium]|jgi:ParB family chromosome partitioning protein
MARKSGLGKGLDALIPRSESRLATPGIALISVDNITPNPRQPRARFDPEELQELAASIREHGVIQPLVVTESDQPEKFVLIAGERRWMAARQAGLRKVPVIFREASDQQLVELALVENVQRADLNSLEAAEAYRQLSQDFGLSHEEISDRVGKSRAAITNTLRLLNLSESVKTALVEEKISEGHARTLLSLPTEQAQSAVLETILKKDLNVRQTEELVRNLTGHTPQRPARPAILPELRALEERLRSHLGTRVSLNRRRKGGTLVIHFYSDEELDTLVDKLLGEIE